LHNEPFALGTANIRSDERRWRKISPKKEPNKQEKSMLRLELSDRVADYATQVLAARSINGSGRDPSNVLSLLRRDTNVQLDLRG
jgi:hypothetical protein